MRIALSLVHRSLCEPAGQRLSTKVSSANTTNRCTNQHNSKLRCPIFKPRMIQSSPGRLIHGQLNLVIVTNPYICRLGSAVETCSNKRPDSRLNRAAEHALWKDNSNTKASQTESESQRNNLNQASTVRRGRNWCTWKTFFNLANGAAWIAKRIAQRVCPR